MPLRFALYQRALLLNCEGKQFYSMVRSEAAIMSGIARGAVNVGQWRERGYGNAEQGQSDLLILSRCLYFKGDVVFQ